MILDIHAHMIPAVIETLIRCKTLENVQIIEDGILFDGKAKHPYNASFTSPQQVLQNMAEKGIDGMAVSLSPRLFFYRLPGAAGAEVSAAFNDALMELERAAPGKLFAVGTLPMQDADLAVRELRRLAENRVFLVQIGTSVNGQTLSAPEYEDLWAECERLGTSVMLHPLITGEFPLMAEYHLSNLVGNPWQTTAAAGDLIFSGVFCRHPRLKVLLVHGGGFLPYQMGRMDQGWRVRPECRARLTSPPGEIMRRNLYFDGLTHSAESLELLLKTAGTGRVLYGSDYPYDMAEYGQREKLEALGLSREETDRVCWETAKMLLRR